MPKMPKPTSDDDIDPRVLLAVNLDATMLPEGRLMGVLGMITIKGQTDYFIFREGAERLISSLQNYLDVLDGKPPSSPSTTAN